MGVCYRLVCGHVATTCACATSVQVCMHVYVTSMLVHMYVWVFATCGHNVGEGSSTYVHVGVNWACARVRPSCTDTCVGTRVVYAHIHAYRCLCTHMA